MTWDSEKIYDAMYNQLRERLPIEVANGVTMVGPHKHDIRFLFNNHDSRYYCSQGQQRALILAFKMAQIRYHKRISENQPILMLDDVLSELDQDRRNYLTEFLNQIDSQIFLTSTEMNINRALVDEADQVVQVSGGQIL